MIDGGESLSLGGSAVAVVLLEDAEGGRYTVAGLFAALRL